MIQSFYYYVLFALLFTAIDFRELNRHPLLSSLMYAVILLIGAGIFWYLDHSFDPVYLIGLFVN